jgi:hypothetical protein
MALKAHLARLERRRGDCRGRPTVFLTYEAGQPVPGPPPGSPRCPNCGGHHPFHLIFDPNFFPRLPAGEAV